MKHYVVVNTKVVREVYRLAAASKTEAIELSKSGSPVEVEEVSEKRVAASDVSPLRGDAV